jgi:hypothetical protein
MARLVAVVVVVAMAVALARVRVRAVAVAMVVGLASQLALGGGQWCLLFSCPLACARWHLRGVRGSALARDSV